VVTFTLWNERKQTFEVQRLRLIWFRTILSQNRRPCRLGTRLLLPVWLRLRRWSLSLISAADCGRLVGRTKAITLGFSARRPVCFSRSLEGRPCLNLDYLRRHWSERGSCIPPATSFTLCDCSLTHTRFRLDLTTLQQQLSSLTFRHLSPAIFLNKAPPTIFPVA
jgi:hypothetical protein